MTKSEDVIYFRDRVLTFRATGLSARVRILSGPPPEVQRIELKSEISSDSFLHQPRIYWALTVPGPAIGAEGTAVNRS